MVHQQEEQGQLTASGLRRYLSYMDEKKTQETSLILSKTPSFP
uniref:Uncharacterized protein n=1 Tax=Anguilla anguilla TaxID=7936 RepID=A0A0E9R5Z2_ANGAN